MGRWLRFFSSVVIFFFYLSLEGMGQRAVIRMNPNRTYQTIDNFAASDAWSCQFIGQWPESKKNAIADWLFSMDTLKDGRPKGIGLSLWRCNIGAGSAGQGDSSGIRDEWRRAADPGQEQQRSSGYGIAGESGAVAESGDARQRLAGQFWFLQAARQRGVKQFLGFLNSPPVGLTLNGKAYTSVPGRSNIDSSRYDAFAAYAVQAIKSIKQRTSIEFSYLSPVNEPQWDWNDGGQEGCPYTNEEFSGLARAFSKAFRNAGLQTGILLPEAGHLRYLLADGDKPGRGDQIDVFFGEASPYGVGGVYNVCRIVTGHSYFSTSPWRTGVELRREVAAHIDSLNRVAGRAKGLAYWQTEYCILGDNAGEIDGNKRDTGMDAALYMARVIHEDLVYGQATAWQWWLAISPYNYKDGLIYVDKNKRDGDFHDSKKLWALGNFSRWVRPGMRRIEVMGGDDSLLVSAYKDGVRGVVVVINSSAAAREIDIPSTGTMYTTNATENLQKHILRRGHPIVLPAKSISTLVIQRF